MKIFVAYDRTEGADAALRAAVEVAKQCGGSQVRMVHALNALTDAGHILASSNHEAMHILRDEELATLRTTASKIEGVLVEPIIEVLRRGEYAGDGLARLASEWEADLIAVASRRAGRLAGALFGSVATGIFRESAVPLLLVHPE